MEEIIRKQWLLDLNFMIIITTINYKYYNIKKCSVGILKLLFCNIFFI